VYGQPQSPGAQHVIQEQGIAGNGSSVGIIASAGVGGVDNTTPRLCKQALQGSPEFTVGGGGRHLLHGRVVLYGIENVRSEHTDIGVLAHQMRIRAQRARNREVMKRRGVIEKQHLCRAKPGHDVGRHICSAAIRRRCQLFATKVERDDALEDLDHPSVLETEGFDEM
ncbi:MAG: hypothetical protein ACK55Z_21805, partial [bacterium]